MNKTFQEPEKKMKAEYDIGCGIQYRKRLMEMEALWWKKCETEKSSEELVLWENERGIIQWS